MRGNSAFDIALWDLFGKVDRPADRAAARRLHAARDPHLQHLRRHRLHAEGQGPDDRQLRASAPGTAYDDLNAFLHRADELAQSLLEEGITAMKIWPFDPRGREDRRAIDHLAADLKAALEPFEKIRKAVGDRMDIMVEFHSMWQLLPAMQIAKALAPYRHLLARGPDPDGQPRRA